MGCRHRKQVNRRRRLTGLLVASATAAACIALCSLAIVQLVSSDPEPAGLVAQAQPVSQDGRIVAVSETSVTAVSADGVARTYLLTPETTSVTGAANPTFAVNDEVSIVGELRNGTAVATAVATRELSNLNGPPMDFALP